ncbi:MAG TPA: sigma 54-interacting transcriptional regulator, partial [Segetibacter sp.]|nr:sigma 54-interacting transcriptional regulator [Segetibacter sp.]
SRAFKNSNIVFLQWQKTVTAQLGIILIAGNESYDQLISILNIQLKHRNNRIIVFNTSAIKISYDAVFKILNYGAEYFFETNDVDETFECIVEKFQRWRNVDIMLNAPVVSKHIIGESPNMKKLLRGIIEVGAYSDVSVLIQGERGTGKELIARLIHELDRKRSNANLVLIDCTTIRPELSGSEFFGHEKGSYTGADNTREGAFALANNGTLFLDEVGETPLPMQAELLRIIQEGVYKKVGSNIWKQTNFRLVCATNRDLLSECEKGRFRKDLNDRISIWKCYMPTLSERKEDIPLLAEFFFKKRFSEKVPIIDDGVMHYLKERDYPGNIRELQNLVNRISLKYVGKGPVTLGDIPETDRKSNVHSEECWYESAAIRDKITEALNNGYDAKSIMDTIKSLVTKIALASTDNNKEVCQLLGKSERWIQLQKAKEK